MSKLSCFITIIMLLWGCATTKPAVRVEIDRAPVTVRGDSIIVQWWQLAFGSKEGIRFCEFPKNAPNPFSRKSGLEIINLTPDTLRISTVAADDVPARELYQGYLGKGYFVIRLLTAGDPSGWRPVTVTVGEETRQTTAFFYDQGGPWH